MKNPLLLRYPLIIRNYLLYNLSIILVTLALATVLVAGFVLFDAPVVIYLILAYTLMMLPLRAPLFVRFRSLGIYRYSPAILVWLICLLILLSPQLTLPYWVEFLTLVLAFSQAMVLVLQAALTNPALEQGCQFLHQKPLAFAYVVTFWLIVIYILNAEFNITVKMTLLLTAALSQVILFYAVAQYKRILTKRTRCQLLKHIELLQGICPQWLITSLTAIAIAQSKTASRHNISLFKLIALLAFCYNSKNNTTIEHQFAYLKHYVELQTQRLSHSVSLTITEISQLSQQVRQIKIAPLWLLNLVSFAYQHGVESNTPWPFIHLELTFDTNVLWIELRFNSNTLLTDNAVINALTPIEQSIKAFRHNNGEFSATSHHGDVEIVLGIAN